MRPRHLVPAFLLLSAALNDCASHAAFAETAASAHHATRSCDSTHLTPAEHELLQATCRTWLVAEAAEADAPLASAARPSADRAGHAIALSATKVLPTVTTTVQVKATSATDTNEGYERRITAREVELSAGTFGDPTRFLQMLPGVVSDNDQRNDFIVRGGNPAETLFVIDNIQLPTINQLALSDTTGGFVSMVDNAAVQHMTLHTDAYDSKFDQRLSAVLEMSTRPETSPEHRQASHVRSEFGVGGTGASLERPLGLQGSSFISIRRSILNLFTSDVGLNGVPIYTNALIRADGRTSETDNWWGISLTGVDSMKIHPSPTDTWETNPFDIDYKGWRNTTGGNWQHIVSPQLFGVASLSNAEQKQSITENSQLLDGALVYSEDSHDGITTAKYDATLQPGPHLTVTFGALESLDRLDYNVQQPVGLPNPYSTDPTPSVAMSLDRVFTTSSTAAYVQAAFLLPHGMKLVAGERFAQWAILGSTASTPKLVLSAPIFGRLVHVGYAEYAQLPPSLYILSFANQGQLTPIRSTHLTAGVSLLDVRRARITVEAYQKNYSHYPVAVDFPQLTLANIADTFGEAFLTFPMTSKGLGIARGVETAIDWKPFPRLVLSSAVSYMRSWYSGLDGVMRKGNFDLPVVANVAGNYRMGRRWTSSFRYSGSTGKPYTPDDLALSTAQNRDVYDLTAVNSQRAAAYRRLDFRTEYARPIHRGTMTLHVGLDNALGTSNFYSNQWRPRDTTDGTLEQKQMPRFPDGGIRYAF